VKRKGFTLIELVVVMAIIAILALIVVGAIILARRTSIETTNRGNAKTIQTALEAYYARTRTYPDTGGTVSFESFATNTGIWADIEAPKIQNTCGGAGSSVENGGTIVSTATTYVITPYNYDCSSAMADDEITMP
jgi:prepilin-type N-terminal cleavage/methylation domain-containing protein